MNWEERRKQLEDFVEIEMSHGEENLVTKLGFSEKRQLAIFETIKAEVKSNKAAEEIAYYAEEDEKTMKKASACTRIVATGSTINNEVHSSGYSRGCVHQQCSSSTPAGYTRGRFHA